MCAISAAMVTARVESRGATHVLIVNRGNRCAVRRSMLSRYLTVQTNALGYPTAWGPQCLHRIDDTRVHHVFRAGSAKESRFPGGASNSGATLDRPSHFGERRSSRDRLDLAGHGQPRALRRIGVQREDTRGRHHAGEFPFDLGNRYFDQFVVGLNIKASAVNSAADE